MKSININIWDDYFEDGFVPEGEIQETYAYVEEKLGDNECKEALSLLKDNIELLANSSWNLELELDYFDSAHEYPNLVGTENEYLLFKRWQLNIKHLTHEAREWLVDNLQNLKINPQHLSLHIYSES